MQAQGIKPADPDAPPITLLDGPPPPVPPATITREGNRATVRAIHVPDGLRLDGRLDEEVYASVPGLGDFIQNIPEEGAPATERTEAWVMFDDHNIYVAARCWDSADASRWIANEMRRDTAQLRQNDTFGVLLDTFYDRRNGVAFYTNPLGGIADFAVTDEGNPNSDWNTVWDVRTGRFDGGWSVEIAIPFKSLRYRPGTGQVWGIQLRRVIRRKNEWTFLTPVPASAAGPGFSAGIFRISVAASLVGLDLPPVSKNFELKPYGIARLRTDRLGSTLDTELEGDVGFDGKYGITPSLTADFTYNTDFAQVEADEQQINLTRFSLFFPEKREFFLEGRGIFDFGRSPTTTGQTGSIVPLMFFSRRIGLNGGRVIPIDGGGRVTGKVGRYGLGVLNIQTGDEDFSGTPSTNFTVLRVKRDVLRRSSVGAMFTNRSDSVTGTGSNQSFGADATFSFHQDYYISGYAAKSQTDGLEGDDASYQARFDYAADRYGAQLDYLVVGDHFNPEVGYLQRDDFKRTYAGLRFSPRPRSIKAVRKFTLEGNLEYILNGNGPLETRRQEGRFITEFNSSDQLTVEAADNYELIFTRFGIPGGLSIRPGSYNFRDMTLTYALGQQRRASGTATLQRGEFYDGTITTLSYSVARVEVTHQLSVEPGFTFNWIRLPSGDADTRLLRARVDYAFTPRMFAGGLVQYNSSDRTVSSNMRFRWEYRPGSELFVVYTDDRSTLDRTGIPSLNNRAFIVKVNRLFRF